MFSQFAEEDKTLSAVFRSDVMHMFCLQLHVCLDTFFGPETDQGSNGVPRVVVYFVTRGYIYIYGATNVGVKKRGLLTQPVS